MSTGFMATQSGTYEVHSNEQTAPQAPTNGFDDDDKLDLENETPVGAEASEDDDDEEDDEQIVVLSGEDSVAEAKDKFPDPAVLKSSTTPSSSSKHHRSGYNSLVGGLSQAIQAKLSQVRRHSASSSSPIPGLVAGTTLGSTPPPETIKCIVHFLDDSRHVFEVDRTAKGEQLMELVFRHLELIEREYFALQFSEQFPGHRNTQQPLLTNGTSTTAGLPATGNCASSTASTTSSAFYAAGVSSNRWLDPSKKIRKQMRFCSGSSPFVLHFRVKFYVSEISRLFEEYTRYHFYLQIRKDILAGRLTGTCTNLMENSDGEQSPQQQQQQQQLTTSSDSWLATLASYVLQSELGDYCPDEHPPGYSSKFRFVPNQTAEFESKVESLHRLHQGQTPADAELNYLEEAKNLDLYGVDLHPARDCTGQEIQIGVCASGLIVFKNGIKINTFSWAKIVKISFKRRLFFVQLKHEGTERFDNMIGFNLCSYRACKALWKSCVEQHTFFRLHTPKPLTKKFFFFFSLGSKFRYSGKTEFQTIEENKKRLTRTERIFIRNNARNATMPAVKLNDAQRHINNLRLTSSSKPTGAANTKDVGFIGADQSVADSAASVVAVGGSCSRLDSGSGAVGSAATTNGHSSHPDIQSVEPGLENNLDQHSPLPPFSATRSLSKLFSSVITSARHRSSSSYSCSNPEMDHPISEQQLQQPATTIRNGFRARHQSSGASLVPSIVRSLTRSAAQTKNSILSQTKKSKFASKSFSSSNSCSSSSASTSSSSTSSSSPSVQAGSCPSLPKKDLVRSSTSCDNIIETNLSSSSKPAPAQLATTTTTTPSAAPTGQVVLERIYTSTASSLPVTYMAAYSPSATISLPFIDQDSNNTNNNQSQQVQFPVQLGKDCAVTTTSSGRPELTSITCTTSSIPDVNPPEIDSSIRELINELYDGAAAVMDSSPGKQQPEQESPVHLVTITMKPDSDGRFGFNVKGGHDQNCPVLVSRVAPNTPADNALPSRLHEGDQVIAINGNQVAGLKHEEVVQLIRSTKNNGPDAELVLSIRPNGFHDQCTDCVEEPPFQYTLVADDLTLETAGTSSIMFTFNGIKSQIRSLANSNSKNPSAKQTSGSNRNSLSETMNSLLDISMNLLQEGLISESLLAQFEQLPRRNENMPITISRYVDNIPKNRYLDIAPYDSTRVVLHECITGDYINASYVNMVIPGSNITNRYIATQGPLKRTVSDFWQMVWEQRCSLIVMVTPLAEDGRKKCYKYWPDQDGQTMLINQRLELTMESCWDEVAFVERKFKLTDTESDEFHQVHHLQYLAWPDQGVPDDDEDFLKLINKVRKLRQFGPNAPVVVHCSAGIGRTGVLILMESGICLIEANQPIYPLELVRTMRNHRAMLIQTTSQFKFVCEALYHVYRDHVVQPLPLYLKPSLPTQPPPPPPPTTTT